MLPVKKLRELPYELADKLAVGEVTNMYDIAEKMAKASLIVSP